MMLAVIADDITGAAEIAGVGLHFGLDVSMVTGNGKGIRAGELLVYATDTRSMTEPEAVEITRKVAREILEAGYTDVFKKTDSALRGHVSAELDALMAVTRKNRTLYLPANPSKNRIIRDGSYYVDGCPLDQTAFAHDPEFPARTALLKERIPEINAVINPSDPLPDAGIIAGNIENTEQFSGYVGKKDGRTILAGGADLFIAYLKELGYAEKEMPRFDGLENRNVLIVLGSTAGQSCTDQPYFQRNPVSMCSMPEGVFRGMTPPDHWIGSLKEKYRESGSMILSVGHPSQGGKDFAVRLRGVMADAAAGLVASRLPEELVIEGGATAFAVLDRLGWDSFKITGEAAPGVVRMAFEMNPPVNITLKPGSYPWGGYLFS